MNQEKERQKLYKLEKEIIEKGAEFYYSIVRGKDDDYLKYVISKRIHSFRHGLYPTNKNIILHEITDNWKEFFNKSTITNIDYLDILNKYKDYENAFLYLDPPYMDSFNAGYGTYQHKSHDEDLKIIDNTEMYIKFLEVLKNGKCKILFSINDCALTNYLYKDFIKETYNHMYQTSHFNIKNTNTYKKSSNTIPESFECIIPALQAALTTTSAVNRCEPLGRAKFPPLSSLVFDVVFCLVFSIGLCLFVLCPLSSVLRPLSFAFLPSSR